MSKTRYIPVALWLVLLAGASWSGWLTTPVSGDLALFMPQPRSMGERLFLTEIGQGPAARIVLIAVEGGTPAQRAGTSRRLARLLRELPGISRVENGSVSRAGRTPEPVFGHRYLLSPSATPSRFTPEALREALNRRLEELTAPVSPFPRTWLPRDPTGEFLAYLRAGHPLHSPKKHLGVWFSPDRAQALLMAETRASALEIEANSLVVSAIETAFQEARGEAPLSLRMSGAGVFAVRSRDTIRAEVRVLSLLASVAVVAILLWFFRSPLLLVLGGLPLASGIVVGWGAVGLFYDGIHGITLAFGVILLGVTLDYPIHLFTHLRPGVRPETVIRQVWPSLRLSWITTALGFGVMITTPFHGLVQVGLLAAAGIATASVAREVAQDAREPRPVVATRGRRAAADAQPRVLYEIFGPLVVPRERAGEATNPAAVLKDEVGCCGLGIQLYLPREAHYPRRPLPASSNKLKEMLCCGPCGGKHRPPEPDTEVGRPSEPVIGVI